MSTLFNPSASIVAQISQLPSLPMTELKALWLSVFKQAPHTHIRAYLERQLAYQLQADAFTREHPTVIDEQAQRITALITVSTQPKGRSPTLSPGTVLTRWYQDCEYQVTVTHDHQFIFQERQYSNLSAIAREITGTRWSGPLFFGLRKKSASPSRTRGASL